MTTTPPATLPAPVAGSVATADPDGPTLVSATDVTKSFRAGSRRIEVLHGVSLRVPAGEMCAVMGPSGSGKSTLLYCLAGLEQPTTGQIRLLDRPLDRLSRAALARMRRRDVGFVFQAYNLVPSLTAFENVALPARLNGERPDRALVERVLASVGLADHVHARPSVMSGGEQQRVALARVLAQRPRIVFADEPTGALDTSSGAVVLAELGRIAHQDDQAVLAVTHDPLVAAACDRVLFMRDGYLVRELREPTAERVAETMTEISAVREVRS